MEILKKGQIKIVNKIINQFIFSKLKMRKADYLPQPVRPDASGCTFFDGEDHDELDRKRRFQEE